MLLLPIFIAAQASAPAAQEPLQEAALLVERKANTVDNLRRAVALYEEHLPKADPATQINGWIDVARAHLRLGDLHNESKEKLAAFEAGKAAGEKAVALAKGASAKVRSEALAWMTFNLAKVGETHGVMNSLFMVGELKKNLEEALKLNPDNSYARSTLASIYHALPGLVGGSDTKAVELCQESIKRSPGFGSGMCNLGKIYADMGKKEQARALFQQVLALERPEFRHDHWKFDKGCAQRALKKLGP